MENKLTQPSDTGGRRTKMKFRIKETQELKELRIVDSETGCEWTADLIGNTDGLHYNEDTEEYEMSQEEYSWWDEYITNYEADEEEIEELADELDIDAADITLRMQNEINCDMEDEHDAKQSVMNDIRKEYGIE